MFSSLDDLNIKLYMQLKSVIPTLFFKLSEITVYLLHKSFKLRLCAITCDCNIDFCTFTFQDFLYRQFYKTKYYDGMRPVSNQPARFLATAKTHKFDTIEDINVKDLKLRRIIDQSGTFIYDVSKVVAQFLKPFAKNEFTISDTLAFPEWLKNIENSDDYEDVSYDVESLFTSITIKETIDYIIYKKYTKNFIEPMCKKSIFKKLLIKSMKECTLSVNNRLLKQTDVCPMGGPISVVFADIYICKMEDDVVAPLKLIFY